MSGAWCREHLVPPPNRRRGPLTTTEYELVEFDRSMTGQRAVYHAIVRTSTDRGTMSATETRLTCTDCGRELHESIDRIFQVCSPCMSRWQVLSVIGTPSQPTITITQDDRDGDDWDEPLGPVDREVQAALIWHQGYCATCDRSPCGCHANGCDVDETVFACLCGTSGVL
jgi:hypothetical protein